MGSNLHRSACRNVLTLVVFLSGVLWGVEARADNKTWDGSSSTNWNTAANWTPSGVPGNNDRAIIPNIATKPIVQNNLSVGQLQIAAGSSVTINGGNTLTVTGLSNLPAANTSVSPVIDGTGSVLGAGLLTVTGGLANGTLINNTMTLGAFTLNAPVGRNMVIPPGTTVTFNGAVNVTQSEMIVGTAAGAANSLLINGALTVGTNGTLTFVTPTGAPPPPRGTLRVSGTLTLTGAWNCGTSTLLLNPTANQTLAITTGARRTFYNVTIQTDGNGNNQVDGDLVTPSAGMIILNDLAITRGQFQVGNFIVDVGGNITAGLSNQSQLDFTNTGTVRAAGNVTLGSISQIATQVNGPFAKIQMVAASVVNPGAPPRNQTFQVLATSGSAYFDLDALQISNPGQTVTILDNPVADFTVNGELRIDDNCNLTVQDVFDPESPLIMGLTSTLRLENTISPDSTIMGSTFTPGTGTVIYAGLATNPNQIVYGQQNNGNLIPYYNLSIDNAAGRTATQQPPLGGGLPALPLTMTGSFAVVGGNSTFTASSLNMLVAQNFTVNGTFNHGGATVTMNGTGIIAGTTANLVFNNLLVSGALSTNVRTANRSFTANNQFRVTQGTLTTSGTLTMSAVTELLVGDGLPVGGAGTATLALSGDATVTMGGGRTFSVNAIDGRFTSSKVAGVSPTITRDAVGNTFLTSIGGQVDLFGLNFSFARYEGLNILSTATVTRLRDVRFTGIFPTIVVNQPPRHLSIAVANLDLDCPGCYFESAAAGYYNVWANGAGIKLRFEDRRSSGSTVYNGPGAGEAYDGDDDANDNGVVTAGETTALHNGALIQWAYTVNIDMTGAMQGFPEPAFDWSSFTYYSTYVVSRQAAGTSDTIYVLNTEGDLKTYSFTPGVAAGNIVGQPYWDTEGGTHVLYFGTTTGLVYKLIDTGAALVMAPAPWNTPLSDSTLNYVSTPIMSDQTNLYFGGNDNLNPGASTAHWGLYRVVISTKTVSPAAINLQKQSVTSQNSWADTAGGRMIFQATGQASNGTSQILRVVTPGWSIDAQVNSTSSFSGPTNVPVDTLFVGEDNGRIHAVNALGTSTQFVEKTGFPFIVNASAVAGTVVWDNVNLNRTPAPVPALTGGRLFFGTAAGEVWELYLYPASWIGSGATANYYRTTPGGATIIKSMPLVQNGIVYVSNSAGKLFVFDADNGAGLALMTTYSWFGNATVGDVSRDAIADRIYVATSAGRLYSVVPPTDPTPTVP